MLTHFRQHRIKLSILLGIILIVLLSALHGRFRPLPKGISYESNWCSVNDIDFLKDLTFQVGEENRQEQEIFAHVFQLIEEAETFLIVDMFLFNDEHDQRFSYPSLAVSLAERIAAKKRSHPGMEIHVITDPINTFYGLFPSKCVTILKDANVPVTFTNLDRLRNSNTLYSAFYAPFFSHFGTSGKGWMDNPFSPDSPKVTLRAFLKMMNFKANHRKVIISGKEAIVSSANPHDASFNHSNIAFAVKGEIVSQILQTELSVMAFSGHKPEHINTPANDTKDSLIKAKIVTDGKIRSQWLDIMNRAKTDDKIEIAMFYIAERSIINALKKAAKRGVEVKLILDANKDAFGREKNGIPNRQVASELASTSGAKIQVRWYATHGEQFHSKLMLANLYSENAFYAIGGSANLTRRNISNYNLESALCVRAPIGSELHQEMNAYMQRLWTNDEGLFTLDYEAFRDDNRTKKLIYRLREFSGFCTF